MKVVLFLPDSSTLGGVEKITAHMATLFAGSYGWEVTILSCFSVNGPPAYPITKGVRTASLHTAPYPRHPLKRIAWYLQLARPLGKWLNAHPSDVIIAQGGYLCAAVALLGNTTVKKIGCEHVSPAAFNPVHQFLRRWLYPRLEALVVYTESYKAHYTRWLHNVVCIPVFLPRFPEERSALSDRLVISIGRLHKQKGYDLLLESWVEVARTHPGWKLVIFGAGEEMQSLEDRRNELDLQQVSFAGETRELEKELLKAAFYVMPSRYEGLPIILLEAMAAGLPCISYDCPGPNIVIENGVNGLMVPPGEVVQFARAIEMLMDDPAERTRMAVHAVETANKFSAPVVGEQWKQLLTGIVAHQ